jgi:hypothetical protein
LSWPLFRRKRALGLGLYSAEGALCHPARFPNHARIIHPDGVAGHDDVNQERLARAFTDVPTPRS